MLRYLLLLCFFITNLTGLAMSQVSVEHQQADEYVERFLARPPAEQARRWRLAVLGREERADWDRSYLMNEALEAHGELAAPFIADYVRDEHEKMIVRVYGLHLLASIDTFRVAGELPPWGPPTVRPYGRPTVYVVPDGDRIGVKAFQVLNWAANQTKHKELRNDARFRLGIFRAEQSELPLNIQVAEWVKLINRSRGVLGSGREMMEYERSEVVKSLLAEQAPKSIPAVVAAMKADKKGYVAYEALLLLQTIDECNFRLRKSDIGRIAIKDALETVQRQPLQPLPRELRESFHRQLEGQFMRDEFRTDPTSPLATLARSMQRLAGQSFIGASASPRMLKYWSYLTDVDASFPSWGFQTCQDTVHIEMHPKYEEKIEMLAAHVKDFSAASRH